MYQGSQRQLDNLALGRSKIVRKPLSEETKKKISLSKTKRVYYKCDSCKIECSEKPSHYARYEYHFCSKACYSRYRKEFLPKEKHPMFGKGMSEDQKVLRRKARSTLNHYLRDKKIERPACEVCGEPKSEAHHNDYDKPLDVKWLCFTHHRQYHKEHPHLLTAENKE